MLSEEMEDVFEVERLVERRLIKVSRSLPAVHGNGHCLFVG